MEYLGYLIERGPFKKGYVVVDWDYSGQKIDLAHVATKKAAMAWIERSL